MPGISGRLGLPVVHWRQVRADDVVIGASTLKYERPPTLVPLTSAADFTLRAFLDGVKTLADTLEPAPKIRQQESASQQRVSNKPQSLSLRPERREGGPDGTGIVACLLGRRHASGVVRGAEVAG